MDLLSPPAHEVLQSLMETPTTLWRDIDPMRRWALVLPREHGAWGILLVSLLTGIAVGASSEGTLVREVWLVAAVGTLLCARAPVENALFPDCPLHPRTVFELRWMSVCAAAFSAIAGVALAMLFTDPLPAGFFIVGVLAAGALEARCVLKAARHHLDVVVQLTDALGLTAMAALAYSVAAVRLDRIAVALWAANGLFATNQILYVQLRIQQQRAPTHKKAVACKRVFVGSELLTVTCLAFWWRIGWIPAAALVAFVPALIHGAIWCLRSNNRSPDNRRLGKEELAHGLVFAGLLFIAFRVSL